jgi:hypothetical protein
MISCGGGGGDSYLEVQPQSFESTTSETTKFRQSVDLSTEAAAIWTAAIWYKQVLRLKPHDFASHPDMRLTNDKENLMGCGGPEILLAVHLSCSMAVQRVVCMGEVTTSSDCH